MQLRARQGGAGAGRRRRRTSEVERDPGGRGAGSRWPSWRSPATSASRVARRARPRRAVVHGGHAARAACAGGRDDELFLILGGDQAAALRAWHEPEEVAGARDVAVVERAAWPRDGDRRAAGRAAGRRAGRASSRCRGSTSRRRWSAGGSPRASRSATSCPTRWRTTSPRRACTAPRTPVSGRRRAAAERPLAGRWPSGSPRSPPTRRRSTSACSTCAGSWATRTSS